ncbi:MAG: ribose 5-phosphate isomerase B [Alphaproteobacteria bacterium]|nr:ribose 5-phosphate isomerase B [Alphaproteobacteria bacterium]
MKIAIASDHGGFKLKQELIEHFKRQNITLCDLGTKSEESCDYPDIAAVMAHNILQKESDLGILICGTGIGISIAANRFKGIRAAILYDDFCAEMAKKHNNANVIVFGGRTMSLSDVIKRIDIFLQTEFEGGRHSLRIAKIEQGD